MPSSELVIGALHSDRAPPGVQIEAMERSLQETEKPDKEALSRQLRDLLENL